MVLNFTKKAVAKFPKLNQWFLFMTGRLSPERLVEY